MITILLHYSTLIYRLITGNDAIGYVQETPNLILPIYPCNLVMWLALVFAFLKNKRSKFGAFLADYLFWFGIISTLVGMFANIDFINNPTLLDYENFKSITAHATLLFNVLLLPFFGHIKTDTKRHIKNIVLSILMMAAVGAYCNLIYHALVSESAAYDINSMFLIHSPFEGLDFLTYPVIALIAIPIYLALFLTCEWCARRKNRSDKNREKLKEK